MSTPSEKTDCTCSANLPDAIFPKLHATDCPEFVKPFERKVPRFDEPSLDTQEVPLDPTDDLFAIFDETLNELFGPRPAAPVFDPVAIHERITALLGADIPSLFGEPRQTRVVSGAKIKTLLEGALKVSDTFSPDSIELARALIRLAIFEITGVE